MMDPRADRAADLVSDALSNLQAATGRQPTAVIQGAGAYAGAQALAAIALQLGRIADALVADRDAHE